MHQLQGRRSGCAFFASTTGKGSCHRPKAGMRSSAPSKVSTSINRQRQDFESHHRALRVSDLWRFCLGGVGGGPRSGTDPEVLAPQCRSSSHTSPILRATPSEVSHFQSTAEWVHFLAPGSMAGPAEVLPEQSKYR